MSSTDLVAGSAAAPSAPPDDGWSRFAPGIRGEGTTARRAWLTAADVANTLPWAEFAPLRKRARR